MDIIKFNGAPPPVPKSCFLLKMSIFGVWQKFLLGIGFHAVGGGRWIVKWRLDGDEMETMRGTDRSIGPPEHQASDVRNTKKLQEEI